LGVPQVLTAASPSEALLKADEPRSIDLLVTDYHLDCAQTGLDVLSALRGRLGERLEVIPLRSWPCEWPPPCECSGIFRFLRRIS
jgi:CheY-like chemotaxis protein